METNYWLMLNDWKGIHDAMHPVTDPDTNETCYTWSGINCPIRQITVRSLGGFNLTKYSQPPVRAVATDIRLSNLHHGMI